MKTTPRCGRSLRLTCCLLLLLLNIIFASSTFILAAKILQKSHNQPFRSTDINITKYNAPTLVSNNQHLPGDLQSQRLPLIHRPSSKSVVLRAILLFYPNDQENDFKPEFRWFYLSWTEMMMNEPSLWRTDLIVYASEYASIFKELDCVHNVIRINQEEKPKCRVFPYVRVKDRKSNHEPSSKYQRIDEQRSQLLYQHLQSYGHIDSINSVFEYYLSYSMYDFILRTDMDCFLTSNFALYVPYNNSLIVGRGDYSTEFNTNRLRRIASTMQWKYDNKTSLGSTWYGSPSMAHRVANFTIQAMLHLALNEFTTPEREQKPGVMLWPEWHFGVLLLYGGHLAINHLIPSEKLEIRIGDQLLDQGVTSKDATDIISNVRLHLYCWQGSGPFSKFDFKEGKYNHIKPSTLVSDTSASGYAMRMALESRSMTNEKLKQRLLNIKK